MGMTRPLAEVLSTPRCVLLEGALHFSYLCLAWVWVWIPLKGTEKPEQLSPAVQSVAQTIAGSLSALKQHLGPQRKRQEERNRGQL